MEFFAGTFIWEEGIAVEEADMKPLYILNCGPNEPNFETLAENETHKLVISDA